MPSSSTSLPGIFVSDIGSALAMSKLESTPLLQLKDVKLTIRCWVSRFLYQLTFISILALFWSLLVATNLALLDPFRPRVVANTNPALGFRPRPENPLSTLIHFKHGGSGTWKPYVDSILNFVKQYKFGMTLGPSIPCKWTTKIDVNTRCFVGPRKWVDLTTDFACSKPEQYGYVRGQPCVVLKVNRIYGWEPEPYYNITEVKALKRMPKALKTKIEKTWTDKCKGTTNETQCPQLRMVWVSCQGATSADREYMGKVFYTPMQGYPGAYFPFLGQMGYQSPVVWVQFRDLTPGVVINVNCKLWAKNIKHDPNNPRVGGVHFELLMD